MGFTMSLNLLLLLAMVATNILSLYHLSTTLSTPSSPNPPPIPDHLLTRLSTIRATITHLTRLHPLSPNPPRTSPPELSLITRLSPLPTACTLHPSLLHQYLSYTPFSLCPPLSTAAAEPLLLRGCHPLPRRRCFAPTPATAAVSLPLNPFSPLPDKALIWSNYTCKSFNCLKISNSDLGFDVTLEKPKLLTFKSDLDLPIPQFLQITKTAKSPIRLGLDIGGGTGTFAAQMKLRNITILTTTMNLGAPFSETVGLRGLVPLHMPLQQRLPVFDGVLDLVRCGRAVNRWIPVPVLEFLLYDVDRVLRVGGYLWVDRFFSKRVDFDRVYVPVFGRLGYKKVKWAVANKTDSSGVKNGEVYLTALLQKNVAM